MMIVCAHCRRPADLAAGHVNRSRRLGLLLYCSRRCSGLAKRKHRTKTELKERKRLYDQEYRATNLASITAKKAAYAKATYDPAKARIARRKTMPRHVAYCRQPKYKAYKHRYDAERYARQFGPFAEAHKVMMALKREIKHRSTDYEIRQENQTFGKSQKRRRADAQTGRDGYPTSDRQ